MSRKFTVIIPTRERPDTFEWALRTCVSQPYENLRIIVSDNFSQDRTRDIVSSLQDPRVKYINPGQRISMSDNWEFALKHVEDGYLMYLGDDDGLLPNIFDQINDIFSEYDLPVLTWKYNTYYWPNFALPSYRNKVTISFDHGVEIRNSKEALKKVLSFQSHWDTLPFLYNFGIVDVRLLKIGKSGRFFNSRIPDVYSSIVLSHLSEKYIHSRKPFSIGGISAHSTGSSQSGISDTDPNKSPNPATIFANEANLPFHPKLVYTHTAAVLIAESYYQAKDAYADFDYTLSIQDVISKSLKEASVLGQERYINTVDSIRAIADIHGLSDFVEQKIKELPNRPKKVDKPVVFGFHITGTGAILNGAEFSVTNVYDAALLATISGQIKKKAYLSLRNQFVNAILTVRKRLLVKLKY